MRTFTSTLTTAFTLCAAFGLSACGGSFKLKQPPAGLVTVEDYDSYTRMKGGDDVGVNITSFGNYQGGTLAFWADDMVRKLGQRDYVLTGQRPVKSKNGVEGTRFDFDYTSPANGDAKFFTAILFVTDEYRVVVQVAGDAEHRSAYEARTQQVVDEIKVKGCKLIASKVCDKGQPATLSTAAKAETAAATKEPADEAAQPGGASESS